MTSRIDNISHTYAIVDDPPGIRAFWIAEDGTVTRGPSGYKRPALRRKLTLEGATELRMPDAALLAVARAIAEGSRQ